MGLPVGMMVHSGGGTVAITRHAVIIMSKQNDR